MRRGAAIVLIAFLGAIFATIAVNYSQRSSLPELAAAYVDLVPRELGAPNVITGILLTYRAFDTLGEVAVLFMVAAGVGLLLGAGGKERDEVQAGIRRSLKETPSTEIVQNGADILASRTGWRFSGRRGDGVMRAALAARQARLSDQASASQLH